MRIDLEVRFSALDEGWRDWCQHVLKSAHDDPSLLEASKLEFNEEHGAAILTVPGLDPAWFKLTMVTSGFHDQVMRSWLLLLGEDPVLKPTVGTSELQNNKGTYYILGAQIDGDRDQRRQGVFVAMTRILKKAWALDSAEVQSFHTLADTLDQRAEQVAELKKQGHRAP